MDLLSATSKYDYVSFDVFNTLLIRKSKNDTELFQIISEELKKQNIDCKDFVKKRINAAEKAKADGKIEPNLDDIYSHLNTTTSQIEAIEKIELTEQENDLTPNTYLRAVITALHEAGKKIIIISDMYLSSDFISALLKKNGLYFDEIFVSSEYQQRKSRGTLYRLVLKKLHINRSKIVHIGDNKKSDYLVPRTMGIAAIHWTEAAKLNSHASAYKGMNISGQSLYAFLMNNSNAIDSFSKIGYELFGPALLGFCEWIHKYEEQSKDKIVFLSRDGLVVKYAYEIMFPGEYQYFLASRRTLTVPQLVDVKNMKDIMATVPYIKREEKVKDFLHKIGIDDSELVSKISDKYGEILSRSDLETIEGEQIYQLIEVPMKENAAIERSACIQYLSENFNESNVAVVDIGWYGTMQLNMEKALKLAGIDSTITGLYFGLLAKYGDAIKAHGFVFDYNNPTKFDAEAIYGFNGLIELMFTADHGSAKKYIIKDGKAECLLEEPAGEYSEFVKKVQEGALHFISDYIREAKDSIQGSRELFSGLYDLLTNPDIIDCELLGNLKFYDAYFERLIQFDGWMKMLTKPKMEISRFLKSNWKIGFLKEMFPAFNSLRLYKQMNKIKG